MAEGRAHKNALVLCALLSALCALKTFALDVPPAPDHWFTDRANLVTPDQATQLNQKLQAFEQKSGAQFIVYVFPSLGDEPLEDFTIRCAEKWKTGQKKYDNGLILFVFAQERKLRFETGYGLEGSVTDAFSSNVIRDVIAPHFRTNDYYGGLNAAIDAVDAKITKGEEPVAPMQRDSGARAGRRSDINPIFVLLILFVVFFVILPMLSRRRSGCGGCFPLFFFPGGGSGITFGGGGFSGGGGWGGGGGGGFSGGGGSFGGGGASGGW